MSETRYPKSKKTWSNKELENIPVEWDGDRLAESPGLVGSVRFNNAGDASVDFRYSMRWKGRSASFYCGSFPKVSMPEIRSIRDEAQRSLKQGIDPRVKRITQRIQEQEEIEAILAREESRVASALTVNDMFVDWLELKGVSRKDGNKAIRQTFGKYILPAIGDIEVRLLEYRHLTKVYQRIVADGKATTAFELYKDVKQMLKWAEKRKPWRQLMVEGNPADLVDIWNILPDDFTKVRERVLSVDEILALKKRFDELGINYRASDKKYGTERPVKKEVELSIWLCLGCLTRIGETLKAEWSHIDFDNRTWFIPKENTKKSGKKDTRTDHAVFLSDFAITKLEELKRLTGHSQWLFPARYTSQSVCEKSVSKIVGDRQVMFKERTKKLSCRVENNSLVLGSEKWTPHDMRRTGATMMQELGIHREIINLCQHHKVGSAVDQHYLKHEYLNSQREAWNKLGSRLEQLLSASNVISIKPKAA